MTELSSIGKIKQALSIAIKAEVGCTLTYYEAMELLGYIKDLEFEYNMVMSMYQEEQE